MQSKPLILHLPYLFYFFLGYACFEHDVSPAALNGFGC